MTMAATKNCPECGMLLNSAALLCPSCGRNVIEVTRDNLNQSDAGTILSDGLPRAAMPYWPAAPAPIIGPPVAPVAPVKPVAVWIALASAVAVIIGSIGPWVSVVAFFGQLSVSGLEADGQITIGLGIGAGCLILFRALGGARVWTAAVAFICLAIAAIAGVADWSNVASMIDSNAEKDVLALARVGWGLQVVTIGSLLGCAAILVHLFRRESMTGTSLA